MEFSTLVDKEATYISLQYQSNPIANFRAYWDNRKNVNKTDNNDFQMPFDLYAHFFPFLLDTTTLLNRQGHL